MRKYILTLLVLATPYLVNAQITNKGLNGKLGISLYGGLNIPANGEYSATIKTTDYLNTGSQFGLGVSYYITKGFGLEVNLYAGYNYHKKQYRPTGKDPVWINLSSNINAIYNFGHMFKKPVISPFVRAGIGSYLWENLEDGLLDPVITKDKNNHRESSFGFNIGAGAEYNLKKNFTIGLILDYVAYYPKHEEQLLTVTNDDHTIHGYFSPQVKLSWYIPVIK